MVCWSLGRAAAARAATSLGEAADCPPTRAAAAAECLACARTHAPHTRDDTTHLTGHFEGFVEVKSKDEVAVMEALMKHGPLAVGVDASFDEFLFYR